MRPASARSISCRSMRLPPALFCVTITSRAMTNRSMGGRSLGLTLPKLFYQCYNSPREESEPGAGIMATEQREPAVIRLDEASPTPKYQQIVEQVRALVASGVLSPRTRLPSVRQLAADLGINVNTVLAAYRALESEGIILLRHGARAVVHPRLERVTEPPVGDIERIRAALERTRTDALLLGMTLEQLRALAAEVFGR